MELDTIIAIDPSRIEAYEQLAVVLIRKTRPDGKKALLWLGKAEKISPRNDDLNATMAFVYFELNDLRSALRYANSSSANSTKPETEVTAHLLLADIHGKFGNSHEEMAHIGTARAIDPSVTNDQSGTARVPAYIGPTPGWFPSSHPELIDRMRRIDKMTR